MTLTEEILTILTSYSRGYHLMRMKMHGTDLRALPSALKKLPVASTNTLRVTLSRLKRAGLIENKDGIWKITQKGKTYMPRKIGLLPAHSNARSRSDLRGSSKSKNMIIAFDIPEMHRRKRNWLRIELANLGFEIMQKSIWFGPAPIPKEFVHSLQELNLLPHVKFFEAKEKDII